MVYSVKRTNIYLPDDQLSLLRRVSESRGRPVAELVRDAVDSWLVAQGVRQIPEDEWQTRFEALLGRRRKVAQRGGFAEDAVMRDVTAAARVVRRSRPARRR